MVGQHGQESTADSIKMVNYSFKVRHSALHKHRLDFMRNPYEVEPNFLTRQKYRDTTLLSDMLFETGSSTLDVTGADKLDSLLEAISINPIDSIIIVGHSDSIGSLSYNENLSLDRAKSVARYMEQRLTRPLKIKVISLAYFRPVAPNDTERGRARNRRVEIYIW